MSDMIPSTSTTLLRCIEYPSKIKAEHGWPWSPGCLGIDKLKMKLNSLGYFIIVTRQGFILTPFKSSTNENTWPLIFMLIVKSLIFFREMLVVPFHHIL